MPDRIIKLPRVPELILDYKGVMVFRSYGPGQGIDDVKSDMILTTNPLDPREGIFLVAGENFTDEENRVLLDHPAKPCTELAARWSAEDYQKAERRWERYLERRLNVIRSGLRRSIDKGCLEAPKDADVVYGWYKVELAKEKVDLRAVVDQALCDGLDYRAITGLLVSFVEDLGASPECAGAINEYLSEAKAS